MTDRDAQRLASVLLILVTMPSHCNFAGRTANCVLINYPAAEKRQWDGIVTRISNTLASR